MARHALDELRVEVVAQCVDEARESVSAGIAIQRGGDHADSAPPGADQPARDLTSGSAIVDRGVRGIADVVRMPDEGRRHVEPRHGLGDRIAFARLAGTGPIAVTELINRCAA